MTTIATAPAASAHGNVNDPVARGYRCLKLYGTTHMSTAYRDSDPMCWNAFQTSPNAMWNWNGMLIDGVGSNYTSVTDICSANNTQYGVLSTPGGWIATDKPTRFTLNLVDQASHGADWIKVYISKDGFNPATERLGWDDLSPVIGSIGYIPTSGNGGVVDPVVGGSAYSVPVDASGYSGRRVLFTHWKASHSDQTYYLCSDVNIGGGGNPTTTTTRPPTTTTTSRPPTTTTTTRPPTTTTSTTRPPTTTTTTTRPPTTTTSLGTSGGCSATYTTAGSWNSGFQGEVRVTAGASPISKWTLTWNLASGLSITQSWSATLTTSGSTVTAKNMSYNGSLGAGASTVFGFLGSGSPTGYTPTVACSTA